MHYPRARKTNLRKLIAYAVTFAVLTGFTPSPFNSVATSAAHAKSAQDDSRNKLDAARDALARAQENERAANTKAAAIETDAALAAYNAALARHQQALRSRADKLEAMLKGGKGKTTLRRSAMEIEAANTTLEATRSQLNELPQSSDAAVKVAPERIANNSPATATKLDITPLGDNDALAVASGAQPFYAATEGQSISPAGDEDYYSFTSTPKFSGYLHAYVDTGGTQNAGGNSRDSLLTLFDSDGTTAIAEDDDDGTCNGGDSTVESGTCSAINLYPLSSGKTYYLRVKGFSSTSVINPYRLFVVTSTGNSSPGAPYNTPATARNFSSVSTQSGEISPQTEVEYFKIAASAGQTFYLNLDGDPNNDGSGNHVLKLYGTDGTTELLTADSASTTGSPAPPAEAFSYRFTAAGTYYVRVSLLAAGTGEYRIIGRITDDRATTPEVGGFQEQESNNTPAEATPLGGNAHAGGVIMEGAISTAGDVDYYSFTSPPSDILFAYVDTGGTQVGGADSRDSVLTLFAADGTTVLAEDDDGGTGNGGDGTIESGDASAIQSRLSSDTTYYLRVSHFSNSRVINPYRLHVVVLDSGSFTESNASNDTAATAVTVGNLEPERYSGSISTNTDVDFYRIEAQFGNVLYVNVLNINPFSNPDPRPDLVVSLIAPDGTNVLLNADSADAGSAANPAVESFSYNVPQNGTYYFRIASYISESAGGYSAMFAALRGSDIAETLFPLADAYVVGADANRNTNYGTATEMQIKRTLNPGAGRGRRGFLKFDISEIRTLETESVKLRIYARTSDPSLTNIPMIIQRVTDTTWGETTITWNNQPPTTSPTALGTILVRNSTARWYEFDVDNFIRDEKSAGRNTISLRLINNVPTGNNGSFFTLVASREATGFRPQLVVYR